QSCAAASAAPKSHAAETASRLRRVSISVPPSARGGEPSDARPSFMTRPMSRASNSLYRHLAAPATRGGLNQRRGVPLGLFFSSFLTWKMARAHRIADGGGRVEGPQFFQHAVELALDLVQAAQDQRETVVGGHGFTASEEEAPAGGMGGMPGRGLSSRADRT